MLNELELCMNATDKVFEHNLHLPSSSHWLEKIDKCHSYERATTIYDYRRWQAKEIGFRQTDLKYLVDALMGSRHTKFHKGEDEDKTVYDWVYNHHNNRQEKKRWQRVPQYYTRMGYKGLFEWVPFASKMEWQCRVAKPNDLNQEIPYGVVLRILEVKALNIFNCFHVLEPVLIKDAVPKPVFLATIWEMPPKRGPKLPSPEGFTTIGYEAHFFLSHWCEE